MLICRAVYNTYSCLFLTEIQVSLVNSGRHRGLWHSTWGYWQTAVYSAAENLSRTDAFALTPLPCSDRARCARCAHTGRCAPHILLISAALSRLFQSKTCPVTVLNNKLSVLSVCSVTHSLVYAKKVILNFVYFVNENLFTSNLTMTQVPSFLKKIVPAYHLEPEQTPAFKVRSSIVVFSH